MVTLNEQEEFWKQNFGDEYAYREKNSVKIIEQRKSEFEKYLKSTTNIGSILEFGGNIGLNLQVLKSSIKDVDLHAVEINSSAVKELEKVIPSENIFEGSFTEFSSEKKFDLVFTRGVLIHLNPDRLQKAYDQLYKYSNRYILISEYYSPEPVAIDYRGFKNKLFKRDFCKELRDRYDELTLIDYGFLYSSDVHKYDDNTWFLLEKR